MGIGPNKTSLLERVPSMLAVINDDSDPFQMMIEQQERTGARKALMIAWAQKHKKVGKPLAPVESTSEKEPKMGRRLWRWIGENIDSKGLYTGYLYPDTLIRQAGFKLPPLKGKRK